MRFPKLWAPLFGGSVLGEGVSIMRIAEKHCVGRVKARYLPALLEIRVNGSVSS